jgi:hypothetical protein
VFSYNPKGASWTLWSNTTDNVAAMDLKDAKKMETNVHWTGRGETDGGDW